MTPWKREVGSVHLRGERRFNSATVVTPWKRARVPSIFREAGGFNSATVVTPWKLPLPLVGIMWLQKLQFGHGCDAVETENPTLETIRALALQFGHGCDAVETSRSSRPIARRGGFNSATVVTPWKLEAGEIAEPRELGLQFGHGCDAVETPAPPIGGARGSSFNSATVVTPWKRGAAGKCGINVGTASIRPRL